MRNKTGAAEMDQQISVKGTPSVDYEQVLFVEKGVAV